MVRLSRAEKVVAPFVPERFAMRVARHLLANFGSVSGVPLLLGVHGPPGAGKTFQIERVLTELKVEQFTISGGQLESVEAGEPAELIRRTYCDASDVLKARGGACLVFNDIDTGGGEWAGNTGTVNHQTVLGELMHLVDFPESVAARVTRRVPVIMTGNDFTKLYEPLRRPGRMDLFEWAPSEREAEQIVSRIFAGRSPAFSRHLAKSFSRLPLSFFSHLSATLLEVALQTAYPTLPDQAAVIRDVVEHKAVLHVSSDSISDAHALEIAAELARSFTVTSHLGPRTPA